MVAHRAMVLGFVLVACTSAAAWKNPRPSKTLETPVFGTHDWIALKAYERAGKPAFIKNNLNRYLIGTEAPDNGFRPTDAVGSYPDQFRCHCILFDVNGAPTMQWGETRTRQEFDKAVAALGNGNSRLAAFYAGALAHYVGDLAQPFHIMGKESHWGVEDKKLHTSYEVAVESTIKFLPQTSTVFEAFMSSVAVAGTTPETIARAVALRVEQGTGTTGRHPRFMENHYATLKVAKTHTTPAKWDAAFTAQAGENLNIAVNGIAKLLLMIVDEGT